MAGGWVDWIDGFLEYSSGIPSPRIFRLWAGIVGVGAALERRVWARSAGDAIYPGLYVLLVGSPGTGKSQPIRHISAMWYATKELAIAPHSVTKASLTDALSESKKIFLDGNNLPMEYSSLQIAASEFGVLVPAHDLMFLNFLNQIYDNDPSYRESLRTGNKRIETINPQINILAGTQPQYLASLLPEEAWGMGFMTRIIMVHSAERFKVRLFDKKTAPKEGFEYLVAQMKVLIKAYGECDWEEDAQIAIQAWNDAGCPPEPEHSRLAAYTPRRILHIIRLCIISAASAGHPTLITLWDFQRALGWLLEAEATMPDIFREMVQRSDAQIIQELHLYCWQIWAKDKKWLHESNLIFFLQSKVPADKIHRILETAVRASLFDKQAGENSPFYKPRPKNDWGVE